MMFKYESPAIQFNNIKVIEQYQEQQQQQTKEKRKKGREKKSFQNILLGKTQENCFS